MKDHSFLSNFDDDDVIAFGAKIYKAGKFRNAAANSLKRGDSVPNAFQSSFSTQLNISFGEWLDKGVECEVLRLGNKSWEKGKIQIRITLEFCPDEPEVEAVSDNSEENIQAESPLDDIRQLIHENNKEI